MLKSYQGKLRAQLNLCTVMENQLKPVVPSRKDLNVQVRYYTRTVLPTTVTPPTVVESYHEDMKTVRQQ